VRIDELDFYFPKRLIAQRPAEPRDSSRLMRLERSGRPSHSRFSDLPGLLRAGDTLVFNDSEVLPAKVLGRKASGGEVELLFLRPISRSQAGGPFGEMWEALARRSHRLRPGTIIHLGDGEEIVLRELLGDGRWLVQGPDGRSMRDIMGRNGSLPLPPYIRSYPGDPARYQTVYASAPGSVAAPTAGLHFTPAVLEELDHRGIRKAHVTLHVGLDTFQPIREAIVEDHQIHTEPYEVSAAALRTIRKTRESGGRLVAVGTTATRVLETLAEQDHLSGDPPAGALRGSTSIFVTPGYRFRAVDLLLTNFHLPRTTVLALVMAFAGVERVRAAYAEAIRVSYRFFSFGDAMLLDREWVADDPGEKT